MFYDAERPFKESILKSINLTRVCFGECSEIIFSSQPHAEICALRFLALFQFSLASRQAARKIYNTCRNWHVAAVMSLRQCGSGAGRGPLRNACETTKTRRNDYRKWLHTCVCVCIYIYVCVGVCNAECVQGNQTRNMQHKVNGSA